MPEPATWTRRVVALIFDWVACTLVTYVIVGAERYKEQGSPALWIVLGIFVLEAGLGTALVGGSFGQLLAGIRVLRTDGHPLSLLPALARSLLVALVVPPLIFKPDDGRGLHDIWTASAAYRMGSRAADAR